LLTLFGCGIKINDTPRKWLKYLLFFKKCARAKRAAKFFNFIWAWEFDFKECRTGVLAAYSPGKQYILSPFTIRKFAFIKYKEDNSTLEMV